MLAFTSIIRKKKSNCCKLFHLPPSIPFTFHFQAYKTPSLPHSRFINTVKEMVITGIKVMTIFFKTLN